MRLFTWFRKAEKTRNIVVYCLTSIVDGNVRTLPIGFIPRFSQEYEDQIRINHTPPQKGLSYINTELNGSPVILCWSNGQIDALSFLSIEDVKKYPNLILFTDDDLALFLKDDGVLNHFPR